uniref:ADAMTS5 n=1 Tax=Dendrocoelum lacteum TaxID=27895 RepID=T1D158_9PLAT
MIIIFSSIILFFLEIVMTQKLRGLVMPNGKETFIKPKVLTIEFRGLSENSSILSIEKIKSIKYQFEVFNERFILNLRQHRYGLGKSSRQTQCHFTGNVNTNKYSGAHFNLCNGMIGVFYWNNKEYFIKPAKPSENNNGYTNPGKFLSLHHIHYNEVSSKKPLFSCKLLEDEKASHYSSDESHQKPKLLQRVKRSIEYENDDNFFPFIDHDVIHDYVIELLIVVTSNMVKRFGDTLKEYILSNIAIATKMLRDPSIKTSIAINVVDIIPLDQEYEKMHYLDNWGLLTQDAVVERFCHWVRYWKRHSKYSWDSAVLINDGSFSTHAIGITHLRSMCAPNSCIAIVDRGFGTGLILAHEIGHQINARHDFEGIVACKEFERKHGESMYNTMMSTSLYFENYPFIWSECSEKLINSYLKSEDSWCLKEQNEGPILYLNKHIYDYHKNFSTGLIYDLNAQCTLAFGEPSDHCNSEEHVKTCSTLYCIPKRMGMCIRSQSIISDGTPCDVDKRCIHGECLEVNRNIEPIDGGWSEYHEWSNCSRLCNGGVQFSKRFCNNPSPQLGGRYCIGTRVRMKSCNIHDCDHEVDIRKEICKRFNAKPYVPRVDDDSVCRLICIKDNKVLLHNLSLVDGTPCYSHKTDICVNSKCYKTGCDRDLLSDKVFDNCRICGGKNDTCSIVKGFFDGSKISSSRSMMVAFKFPKNVTNVFVRKVSQRLSPFSEEVFDDFQLLLLIDHNTMIRRGESIEPFPGGELYYSGSNKKEETYRITGLIQKEIVVLIRTENPSTLLNIPSVDYHYYVPNQVRFSSQEEYSWKYSKINSSFCFGHCNAQFEIKSICFKNKENIQVSDTLCKSILKPKRQIKQCRSFCDFRWQKPTIKFIKLEAKQSCPVRCGNGSIIINHVCQKKTIMKPRQNVWETVPENHCFSSGLLKRPNTTNHCVGSCNPLIWSYGNWENCSKSCGSGFRKRTAICKDTDGRSWNEVECLKDLGGALEKEPCISKFTCKEDAYWAISNWSVCSKMCGLGTQTRDIACLLKNSLSELSAILTEKLFLNSEQVSDSFCLSFSDKPLIKKTCIGNECYQWNIKYSAKCSVTCGVGSRISDYICVKVGQSNITVEDKYCFENRIEKPKYLAKPCIMNACYQPKWLKLPWGKCSESCGKGMKLRLIRCGYKTKRNMTIWLRNDAACRNESRPAVMEHCQNVPCSTLRYGPWSRCQGTCLYGNQQRTIECIDENSKKILPDSACESYSKLQKTRKCLVTALCGHWKVESWSKCSVSCGLGTKTRAVSCLYVNGSQSSDTSICQNASPIKEIYCENPICKSKAFWWLLKSSQCYAYGCKPGVTYSDIRCVNNAFQILPDYMCDDLKHPNYYAECIRSECRQYFWSAESWSNIPCSSNSCMMTIRNRQVTCVDEYGNVYGNSHCDEATRLDDWRLCASPRNCSDVPRSCKELKERHPETEDGEYSLAIDLNWTYFIFCSNMKTESPTEYLTLKRPNYAKASHLLSIPNNKTCMKYEDTCSDCRSDETLRSITYYNKVRLNMTDLSIDIYDNQYSTTIGSAYVPYGTAKDCAGSKTCPQGHFVVDLSATEFSVSMKTSWNELHNNYGYKIVRTKGSQVVKGWCGGECSGCNPLPKLYIEPQMYGRDLEVKSYL